jgi:hypothetical protein
MKKGRVRDLDYVSIDRCYWVRAEEKGPLITGEFREVLLHRTKRLANIVARKYGIPSDKIVKVRIVRA